MNKHTKGLMINTCCNHNLHWTSAEEFLVSNCTLNRGGGRSDSSCVLSVSLQCSMVLEEYIYIILLYIYIYCCCFKFAVDELNCHEHPTPRNTPDLGAQFHSSDQVVFISEPYRSFTFIFWAETKLYFPFQSSSWSVLSLNRWKLSTQHNPKKHSVSLSRNQKTFTFKTLGSEIIVWFHRPAMKTMHLLNQTSLPGL